MDDLEFEDSLPDLGSLVGASDESFSLPDLGSVGYLDSGFSVESFSESESESESVESDGGGEVTGVSLEEEFLRAMRGDDDSSGVEEVDDYTLYQDYMSDDSEEDFFGGFDIDEILADAIDEGASDVHISADDNVSFTILGDTYRRPHYSVPDGNVIQRVMQNIISHVLEDTFITDLELDTSYVIRSGRHAGRRMRLSVGKSFGDIFLVFRVISSSVPSPEVLGVSDELLGWTQLPNGLIMMNGPTGTGKALRVDTVVPTPFGNTTMGDLTIGSIVFDRFGEPCRVDWVSEVDLEPYLFKLDFVGGGEVFADANHCWFVKPVGSLASSVVSGWEVKSSVLRELSLRFSESELGTYSDVVKIYSDYDCLKNFSDVFSIRMLLRYMEVPVVVDEFGVEVFRLRDFFEALSLKFDERFTGGGEFFVLTVWEVLSELVANSGVDFVVPSVGGGERVLLSVVRVGDSSEDYGPVRCIRVDSLDSSFVCGDGIVTHNSTTLASLLKRIQLTRSKKIITLEKPVEFVFGTEGKALVTQREIGRDARSFARALTSAMRQAPDIIMVGEVRDQEEVNELLRAAETGHLSISTMHTNSVATTLNRIKSLYKGDDQLRILSTLSDVSRGFANQVLVKTVDGKSRFAVREVLSVDDYISKLIARGDVPGIRNFQIENGITMEHGLVDAVVKRKCTREEARAQSAYPTLFDELLASYG